MDCRLVSNSVASLGILAILLVQACLDTDRPGIRRHTGIHADSVHNEVLVLAATVSIPMLVRQLGGQYGSEHEPQAQLNIG